MKSAARLVLGMALAGFVYACAEPVAPSRVDNIGDAAITALDAPGLASVPPWVVDPLELPSGLQGRNNCLFTFPEHFEQWNVHPEGACWERPVPDGWTRQQLHQVHMDVVPACGGRPGDVSSIRICRPGGANQPSPCPTPTGPAGCALCVPAVVSCH